MPTIAGSKNLHGVWVYFGARQGWLNKDYKAMRGFIVSHEMSILSNKDN